MAEPLQRLEGKYEILSKIAEGGMGAIYKVRHRLLDEVQVVKVMRPQVEEAKEYQDRFLREARIAVKVRHPNIAQMYDFSVDDEGTAFIVMEYIDGVTLEQLLKTAGAPPSALGVEIAVQSLKALGYLHGRGIVHRDISPDNIMVETDHDGEPLVKLIDLGIAKATHGKTDLTATGMFIGKVRYASPEHSMAAENVKVSHASDLYSLGVVLYELLTGVFPFRGEAWTELIGSHLYEQPRSFTETDPDNTVSERLREIVLHAMAKKPEDRFSSADAFVEAVQKGGSQTEGLAESLDTLLRLCRQVSPIKPHRRPGTTQDRLDSRFAGGQNTAAAAAMPGPVSVTTRTGPEGDGDAGEPAAEQARVVELEEQRRVRRARELCDEARELVDGGEPGQAVERLEGALGLDPKSTQAGALLDTARQAVEREEAIAQAIADVEELLGRDLDQAVLRIQEAIDSHGEAHELVAVRARVEELEGERQARRAGELCDEARKLIDGGEPVGAVERLQKALEIDPESTQARMLIDTARRAAERKEAITRHVVVPEELSASDRDEACAHTLEAVEAREGGLAVPEGKGEPERAGDTEPPRAQGILRRRWLWAAAGAVVVAGIVVAVMMRGGAAVTEHSRAESLSGSTTQTAAMGAVALVIDALPWAEVLEVVNADRDPVDLPVDRSTPFSLNVPPGEYRISLRGPKGAEPVVRVVVVRPGEDAQLIERFERPDGRQLLERYGL